MLFKKIKIHCITETAWPQGLGGQQVLPLITGLIQIWLMETCRSVLTCPLAVGNLKGHKTQTIMLAGTLFSVILYQSLLYRYLVYSYCNIRR